MATRGLLKGRASRFLIQSSFILNLLTRMSSLVRLEDKQKTINAAASQSLKPVPVLPRLDPPVDLEKNWKNSLEAGRMSSNVFHHM